MVEVFFNKELSDVCFETESLDEWKSINESLGLDAQLGFVKTANSPVPFPIINESMKRIFKTLCPAETPYKRYDRTPIPLEVLKQLQYCVKENFFSDYEIWYDDVSPDPFLIGIKCKYYGYYNVDGSNVSITDGEKNTMYFDTSEAVEEWCINNEKEFKQSNKSTWGEGYKLYLIARWADVQRPMTELKEMAKDRVIEHYGATLKNTITEAQEALKKLTENATLYLNGVITEGKLKGTSNF